MDFYPTPLVPARIPQTPIVNVKAADRVAMGNTHYIMKTRDKSLCTLMREDDFATEITLTNQEFYNLVQLKQVVVQRNRNAPEFKLVDVLYGERRWEDYSEKARVIADFRIDLFTLYDAQCIKNGHIPRSQDGSFENWIRKHWGEIVFKRRQSNTLMEVPPPPSVSTFERVYTRWKACNHNKLAALPRNFGPGKKDSYWTPDELDFAVNEARSYMSDTEPRKSDVFLWYKAALDLENEKLKADGEEPLRQVKRTAFYNIIDSFPAFDVMCARKGEDYARKHFSPVIRSFDAVLPGQHIEIDCVKTDMATLWAKAGQLKNLSRNHRRILKKIRIWFVVAICRATRYVLGMKATVNPSAKSVIDTVRMVMTDKTLQSDLVGAKTPWAGHVNPSDISFDNGGEFIDLEVTKTLQAAGFSVTTPPAGEAPDRPFIESFFHTIGPLLTAFFSGRTFASISTKGDYDPAEHAGLFVDEFVELFHLGICDIYHNKPHSSLGGKSPHNAFWEACEEYGYDPPPGVEETLRAFGRIETVTLDQYGVKRLGLSYRNELLDQEYYDIGRSKVEIVVDDYRVNDILVKGKKGWFLVPNQNGLDADITEAEWLAARRSDLQENAAQTESNVANIYDAVNRMRRSGEAAVIRADLSPMKPSQEYLNSQRRRLFSGYEAPVASPQGAMVSEIELPRDELRGDAVSPVPKVVGSDNPFPAPTRASKFNRKWEDD